MKYSYFVLSAVLTFVGLQAQAGVLGSASSFGLLGGSGVANAGLSIINNGNVGSAPISAVTGFPPGVVNNGILYTTTDAATDQAHADLNTAYGTLLSAPGGAPGPADLGGITLSPGVYTYASTAPWTAGTLTLDALGDPDAQWIFRIGTGLTTPADAEVVLMNGASPENVYWQIGTSATLGADNIFSGTILAQTSITLGGGTLNGRALAIGGLVAITGAELLNVPQPVIPEPATCLLLGGGLMSLVAGKKRRSAATV